MFFSFTLASLLLLCCAKVTTKPHKSQLILLGTLLKCVLWSIVLIIYCACVTGGTNEGDHSDSPSVRKCLRKTRGELILREYEVLV